MDEEGVVKTVEGPMATVIVPKKMGVCEKCTAGTCHLSDEGAEIEALNDLGAKVGQKVRIHMKPVTYLKGSLMMYGLPALALIIGAVVGKETFSQYFPGLDPETVSAIFGFGALAISLVVVKIWSSFAEKKTEYKPVIEKIIE